MPYKLIRSDRKTLSIQIDASGVTVRAPLRCPQSEIDEFVRSKSEWIEKNLAKFAERSAATAGIEPLSQEELNELARRALEYIPKRAAYYAPLVGVKYTGITIRNQRTRWGSCSSKGRLNFNCLLMLTPPEVIDSVVVHELCHLKEMNHSERFYAEVLRVMPDYRSRQKWLKDNGNAIMKRNI